MISARHCSKPGCQRPAVATLTYDYQDSTVVLGPLAGVAEPNAYDLCDTHAEHLTAPKGWQIVRLVTTFEAAPPSSDDLLALVDAVRRAAGEAPERAVPSRAAAGAPIPRDAPASPERAPRLERGPFTRVEGASASPDSSGGPVTGARSPLDPKSEFAQRRARFTVVRGADED